MDWLPARSKNCRRAAIFSARALDADLKTLAESRSSIDEAVAGHVAKLADGRNMLARALEDDLRKIAETRAQLDDIVQGHVQHACRPPQRDLRRAG